eukprot:1835742-Alexandrium_andersonii.AAC.1
MLGEPQRKVGLLPGRFGTQPPGQPQKMIGVGEERGNRAVAFPAVDQPPDFARTLKQSDRAPEPAGVRCGSADCPGEGGGSAGAARNPEEWAHAGREP